jgi:hypothetical protein
MMTEAKKAEDEAQLAQAKADSDAKIKADADAKANAMAEAEAEAQAIIDLGLMFVSRGVYTRCLKYLLQIRGYCKRMNIILFLNCC